MKNNAPPMRTITRAQVRELDRRAIEEFGVPGIVLMENAGRGATEKLNELGIDGQVVICCGKGNNGGDGLVIARHLHNRGLDVEVVLFCNPSELKGDAATNFNIVKKSAIPFLIFNSEDSAEQDLREKLLRAAWIIDALLGTGATGEPRGLIRHAIELINEANRLVLAIDLPSGLDCDTGIPAAQTVRATHTCTFVAEKTGFTNPLAKPLIGFVDVVDIGAPRILVAEMTRAV
jgi:NAD(P)H-hydrate epimerase